jgi:exodeoxyribonuclease VII small subunit
MKETEPVLEKMSFEEAFAALEKIVQVLDTSDATLAESISLYEKGQLLMQHCSNLLKDAELKLQTIQEINENSKARE